MAHYPLFVITTVPPALASRSSGEGSGHSPADQEAARAAAQEAWGVLFQHISAPENREARRQPRTLSLGGEQYRYIHGQPPLEGTPSGAAPPPAGPRPVTTCGRPGPTSRATSPRPRTTS